MDRLLVALQCTSGRPLAAPADTAQDAPNLGRVVLDAEPLLDHFGNAPNRPQTGVVSDSLWPRFEQRHQLLALLLGELRLASRASRFLESRFAGTLQCDLPAVHRLAMYTELASNLSLRHPLLQHYGGTKPPLFERIEVPPHPSRISHKQTLACQAELSTIFLKSQ